MVFSVQDASIASNVTRVVRRYPDVYLSELPKKYSDMIGEKLDYRALVRKLSCDTIFSAVIGIQVVDRVLSHPS